MKEFNIHGHILGWTSGNSWNPDIITRWKSEGKTIIDVCRPTIWLYIDGKWIATHKAPEIIMYALLASNESDLLEYLKSEGIYDSETIRMAEERVLLQ